VTVRATANHSSNYHRLCMARRNCRTLCLLSWLCKTYCPATSDTLERTVYTVSGTRLRVCQPCPSGRVNDSDNDMWRSHMSSWRGRRGVRIFVAASWTYDRPIDFCIYNISRKYSSSVSSKLTGQRGSSRRSLNALRPSCVVL